MRWSFLIASLLGFASSAFAQDATSVKFGRTCAGPEKVGIQVLEWIDGANAYLKRVNDAGGVHGRKVQIITEDDLYDPQTTLEMTKKHIETTKVFGLFGYCGSPTTAAALPYIKAGGIPLIAPHSGASFLRTPLSKEIFNVRASYPDEAETLVKYAVQTLKHKKVGVFYQDDAFGTGGKAGIQKALASFGMKVEGEGAYDRKAMENVEEAIKKIRAAGAETVIIYGVIPAAVAFIKKSVAMGYRPVFMSTSIVAGEELIEKVGADGESSIFSTVAPLPNDDSLSLGKSVMQDMKAYGSTRLGVAATEGYMSAMALVEGLRLTGRDLTRPKFIEAMEKIKNFDAGGMKFTFSATQHQASSKVFLVKIEKGKYVSIR